MPDTTAGGGSGGIAGPLLTLGGAFASDPSGLAGAREIAGPRSGTVGGSAGGTAGAAGWVTGTFREARDARGALAAIEAANTFALGTGAGAGGGGATDAGTGGGTTEDAFVGRGMAATSFAEGVFFSAGFAPPAGVLVSGFVDVTGTFWADGDTGVFGGGTALATSGVVAGAFVDRRGFADAGTGTGGNLGFGVAGVERRTGFIVFE